MFYFVPYKKKKKTKFQDRIKIKNVVFDLLQYEHTSLS